MSHHTKVLREYETLRHEYNDSLENVKHVYREGYASLGNRLGEFEARRRTEVDVEKLMRLAGPNAKNLVTVQYKLDRKRYTEAIASGKLPQELVNKVEVEVAPSIYGPKAI